MLLNQIYGFYIKYLLVVICNSRVNEIHALEMAVGLNGDRIERGLYQGFVPLDLRMDEMT